MRRHRGSIAGLVVFACIALGVATSAPLVGLDHRITAWFQLAATPALTGWVLLFTNANDPIAISVYGTLLAVWFRWRRERFWLAALAVVLPAGMLINVLLKHLFQRARPSVDEPLLSLSTYSFPSGHVAGAVLFYGVLAAFLAARQRPGRRWLPWLGAALVITLIALSRVYLGVHFFTDVVAAIAWSMAWLVFWLSDASPLATARLTSAPLRHRMADPTPPRDGDRP